MQLRTSQRRRSPPYGSSAHRYISRRNVRARSKIAEMRRIERHMQLPPLTRFLRRHLQKHHVFWRDPERLKMLFEDEHPDEFVIKEMRRVLTGESFCITQFQAAWWAELLDLCCEEEKEFYELVTASCTAPRRHS